MEVQKHGAECRREWRKLNTGAMAGLCRCEPYVSPPTTSVIRCFSGNKGWPTYQVACCSANAMKTLLPISDIGLGHGEGFLLYSFSPARSALKILLKVYPIGWTWKACFHAVNGMKFLTEWICQSIGMPMPK